MFLFIIKTRKPSSGWQKFQNGCPHYGNKANVIDHVICDRDIGRTKILDWMAEWHSGYVQGPPCGTIGGFAIAAIGCHWYHWRPQNPEQYRQPMTPVVPLVKLKRRAKRQIPRQIWGFAGRSGHFVVFVMLQVSWSVPVLAHTVSSSYKVTIFYYFFSCWLWKARYRSQGYLVRG